MEVFDVSTLLSEETIVYPGDPKIKMHKVKKLGKDKVNLSKISMGLHSGTHVDAPAHYLSGGKTIDEINLGLFIGKARVCDAPKTGNEITAKDLKKHKIGSDEIVLFKTNRKCFLGFDGADYLTKKKIKAVGIDNLSIEKAGSSLVHKKLLSNNIPIIEGLVLKNVPAGIYQMVCLPLKIKGGEAAPARCMLLK